MVQVGDVPGHHGVLPRRQDGPGLRSWPCAGYWTGHDKETHQEKRDDRLLVDGTTPDARRDGGPGTVSERQEFDAVVAAAFGEALTEEDLVGDPDYNTPEQEPYSA